MTNYCDNFVRIKVPKQHKDALLDAFKGPAEIWWGGKRYLPHDTSSNPLSAHEQMQAERHRKEAQQAYSKQPGCPDWYQVTHHDILLWQEDPALKRLAETTEFSVPRFLAWKSPDEMAKWNHRIIEHARLTWGCKWMPNFDGKHWEECHTSDNGYLYLDIKGTTPNTEPNDPISLFLPALRKANAEMVWIFQNEGDHGVGGWWTENRQIHMAPEEEYSCPDESFEDDDLDDPYLVVDFEAAGNSLIEMGVPQDLIENLF